MKGVAMHQERRKQAALEKLGSHHPRCMVCGVDDWRCLERHHIAGRTYDEVGAILCRNCHRKVSDDQRDHPAKLPDDTSITEERVGHFLLGLADLLRLLVEKLVEFGHALITSAAERSGKDGA